MPHYTPVQQMTIVRPPCPQCGAQMMVARIQQQTPGIEERTYECAKCRFVEKLLIKNQ